MDATLVGWNGPLLVPSTAGLDRAYRLQAQSGFQLKQLEEIRARLSDCEVVRQGFQTRDGHCYFWGLEFIMPGAKMAVLFPWLGEALRPVCAYVQGELPTAVIKFVLGVLEACFASWAPRPAMQPVFEIELGRR